MVSTHLKNISQIGHLPQIGVNIKNVWNHQKSLPSTGHGHNPGDFWLRWQNKASKIWETVPNHEKLHQTIGEKGLPHFPKKSWVLMWVSYISISLLLPGWILRVRLPPSPAKVGGTNKRRATVGSHAKLGRNSVPFILEYLSQHLWTSMQKGVNIEKLKQYLT